MTRLLFIPGLLSDARVWEPVADALDDLFPCAFGDVTRGGTIPEMAAQLLADHDGPLIPVGHSMGGRVAMEVARQAPERTRALVLANTGHGPLKDGEAPKREAKIAQGHADMAGMVAAWLPPMMAPARTSDRQLMDSLAQMALSVGPQIHEAQIRALMARPDAATYLPQIPCPVLLMTGAEDGWSPVAQHQEIAALLPDVQLEVIAETGHFMPIEAPQEVADRMRDWLAPRVDLRAAS